MAKASTSATVQKCVVDPEDLKAQVKVAIIEGQRRHAQIEEERAQLPVTVARSIIANIPQCIRAAVADGKPEALVMRVTAGSEFRRPPGIRAWTKCQPEWLIGAASLVWDACTQARLRPSLKYQQDCGQSWFDLNVHW